MDLLQKLSALKKWFKEKEYLIRFAYRNPLVNESTLTVRMGDVYLAKFGVNVGNETDKMRPALVFQGKDRYLRGGQTVFVFPISSNSKQRKYRVLFNESDIQSGSLKAGSILIQSGRTLSTFRLGRKLGRLHKAKLVEVQHVFEDFLYKNTPLQPREAGGQRQGMSSGSANTSSITTTSVADAEKSTTLNLRALPGHASSSDRCFERQRRVQNVLGADVSAVSIDPTRLGTAEQKNCENMFGHVPLPVGLAGPLSVQFSSGDVRDVYAPLATTEGALVASVNRGCKAVDVVRVKSEYKGMTRSVAFKIENGKLIIENLLQSIEEYEEQWKAVGESTSNHLNILSYDIDVSGPYVFLTIACNTDEAMGMNMVTIAAQAIGSWIAENIEGLAFVTVAGNVDSDKKPSQRTHEKGRGYTVIAEAVVPQDVVQSVLKTTPEAMFEVAEAKLNHGSTLAGTIGSNMHAANIVAALYLATGQDAAHVVEGSLADTNVILRRAQDDTMELVISVRMPAVIVGVRGGGTVLPAQKQCLDLLLKPEIKLHPCKQLAESVAAMVLCGELSLLAAQAGHHLASAHKALGR